MYVKNKADSLIIKSSYAINLAIFLLCIILYYNKFIFSNYRHPEGNPYDIIVFILAILASLNYSKKIIINKKDLSIKITRRIIFFNKTESFSKADIKGYQIVRIFKYHHPLINMPPVIKFPWYRFQVELKNGRIIKLYDAYYYIYKLKMIHRELSIVD